MPAQTMCPAPDERLNYLMGTGGFRWYHLLPTGTGEGGEGGADGSAGWAAESLRLG